MRVISPARRSLAMDKDYDTKDRTERFSGDQKLRRAGFKIHGRPEKGEPLWEREGKVYKESEARRLSEQEQ